MIYFDCIPINGRKEQPVEDTHTHTQFWIDCYPTFNIVCCAKRTYLYVSFGRANEPWITMAKKKKIIRKIRMKKFIDLLTDTIVKTFSPFSRNIHIHCIIKLLIERRKNKPKEQKEMSIIFCIFSSNDLWFDECVMCATLHIQLIHLNRIELNAKLIGSKQILIGIILFFSSLSLLHRIGTKRRRWCRTRWSCR